VVPAPPRSPRRQNLPLRVLIVGPLAPPFGGMSIQSALLERKLVETGVAARRLPTNPGLGVIAHVRVLRYFASHVKFLIALVFQVAQSDVVHVLGASWFYYFARVVPSIIVARSLNRRVVVNYRGGQADAFFSRYGSWATFFLARANALTVPSPFLARVFARHGLSAVEVPNITDLDRFRFRLRSTLRPRILVNRNFDSMYNVALAIDAFARIKKARPAATLTLAGSGPLERSLRDRVERLGLSGITFYGPVDNAEMADLYEAHDVYVNPTDADNMPISILECLAAGVPVVSTNVGGIPDLLEHGKDGLLVPPRDPDAMAAAVLSLLDEPAFAERVITAGVRKARSFGWEAVWPRLRRVYVP
jgi:glycosyltransferase involved in cell wall biosynthesis